MTTPRLDPAFDAIDGLISIGGPASDTGELFGCRTERKLVVAPEAAAALRTLVAARLALEQYVPGRRKTAIHSIYFDTADFALYRRSMMAGPAPSLKLRLRAYGDAATPDRPDPSRFLEAKLGVTVAGGPRLKRKARLSLSDRKLARLMAGNGSVKPISRRKFWRPLLEHLAAFGVGPRLTVSYVREAFVNSAGTLRITFDEGYRASLIAGTASPLDAAPGLLGDAVVVEIKFLVDLPAWLLDALAELGLPPEGQPFSKFKTAVPLLFPVATTGLPQS